MLKGSMQFFYMSPLPRQVAVNLKRVSILSFLSKLFFFSFNHSLMGEKKEYQRSVEDYNKRNIKKQTLNRNWTKTDAQVGEIWWYYCGVNIWNEIGKWVKGGFRRVCIILKNDLNNGLILVAPLSTKLNEYSKGNTIRLQWYDRKAWVLINQITLIDHKRFMERLSFKYSKKFVKKVLGFYKSIISI